MSPELGEDDSMALLSDIVAACDEAAEQHGVEKVRTIGSSYLAVSGLSVERPDHTARMVDFAREVVRIVKRFNAERGVRLVAEIGINAGPVVGGLVGRRKFIYDLWGDTVKLARGIESDGKTSILVTRPVYDRVRDLVAFGSATTVDVAVWVRSSCSRFWTRPPYERIPEPHPGISGKSHSPWQSAFLLLLIATQ